jgi:hypothetical protein
MFVLLLQFAISAASNIQNPGYGVDDPGIEYRQGRKEHSPSYNAEVRNEWRYTSTLHIFLLGLDMGKLIFHILT